MNHSVVEKFWRVYDEYVDTYNRKLFPELSNRLSLVEQQSRSNQILRLEKGWKRILAWQVLRDQAFIFSDNNQFNMEEGEILAWQREWDRDTFLTRSPILNFISNEGSILSPGVDYSLHNRDNTKSDELKKIMKDTGLANQKGLYLPIFEERVLYDLINKSFADARNRSVSLFKEHVL